MLRVYAANLARTQTRLFATTAFARKEDTSNPLKKVDRVVSDAAVAGIEKGEEAAQTVKEAVSGGAKKAAEEAKDKAGDAKEKAQEVKQEAEGKK